MSRDELWIVPVLVVLGLGHVAWRPTWESVAVLVVCAALAVFVELAASRKSAAEELDARFSSTVKRLSERMDVLSERCDNIIKLQARVDSLGEKHDALAAAAARAGRKPLL